MAKQAELPPCYATVMPGLEDIAADEIARDFAGDVKRAGHGVVVFRVDAVDRSLLQLRTTEDVFLLAWGTDQLSYRAADLDKIRRWTERDADWARLLQLHHQITPKPAGKPTYRFVVQMTGTHGYRRMDAQKALTRGLEGKIPASWRFADENAALEIWLTIHGATAVCGVRLSNKTMRHRTYKLEHFPASLRPTVAAAMVRLGDLKPGQTLLDPMCGAGTILAEAMLYCKGRRGPDGEPWQMLYLGSDVDPHHVRFAATNLRALGPATLRVADVQQLPYDDASVDRILCNPPFGKQLSTLEEIVPLYRQAVREMDRVLRPGGRAVLLVAEVPPLREAAERVAWRSQRQVHLRVLGQRATLLVFRKES